MLRYVAPPTTLCQAMTVSYSHNVKRMIRSEGHFSAILRNSANDRRSVESPQQDWSINLERSIRTLRSTWRHLRAFRTRSPIIPWSLPKDGENGTLVAVQFVTEAKFPKDLAKAAPADWKKKNIEIVITTQTIDEKPGPPRILATYFW